MRRVNARYIGIGTSIILYVIKKGGKMDPSPPHPYYYHHRSHPEVRSSRWRFFK
jgi:hypothetical protein